ncbi:MAG TPA: hypothetical protein VMC62_04160, partial [Longilinea sp.]|nr:hypothetical protein [Longilinea sp.]
LEGIAALLVLMRMPSEAGSARVLGYSYARLAVAAVTLLATLLLAAAGVWFLRRPEKAEALIDRAEGWLLTGDRLFFVQNALLIGFIFLAGAFLFTWLFILPHLRGLIAWAGLTALQLYIVLRVRHSAIYRQKDFKTRYRLLPRLSDLEPRQKHVLLVLLLVGLAYFAAFIPTNLQGAEDEHQFYLHGGDEYVIYPILTQILTPGNSFSNTLYHLFIYEDYHYGYPFYVASALVLLPVRLVDGMAFTQQYQLNLLLLRQLISVLPMVLAALVITYLGTRWRSYWKSLILFALILTIPGVVKYNQAFWHPDALAVLMVALTLYFLDRDRLRFGRNFYLAALTCGLASAIRLVGFFFVLAIAGYLLAGWLKKVLTLKQLVIAGLLFIVVMGATTVLSNPFLFEGSARARFVEIMQQKNVEMAQGYNEPDPQHIYRTGWDAWLPFFINYYGAGWFLAFLVISAGAAALLSKERLFPAVLLGWAVVMAGYLVYFVAVKSYQYMLPLFVPLYGAALLLPSVFDVGSRLPERWMSHAVQVVAWGVTLAACAVQLVLNLLEL